MGRVLEFLALTMVLTMVAIILMMFGVPVVPVFTGAISFLLFTLVLSTED